MQEKIWQPGGFTSDATWGMDSGNIPMGHCCLSVTLQDFAHLGQIYLDGLMFDGNQTVHDNWFNMVENAQGPFQEPFIDEDGVINEGYSFQFWLPHNYDQEFMAQGAFGNYLWVDRKREFVVAHFSISDGLASNREKEAFFRAIGDYLANEQ